MSEGSERSRLGSLIGRYLVGLGLSERSLSEFEGGVGVIEGSSSLYEGLVRSLRPDSRLGSWCSD